MIIKKANVDDIDLLIQFRMAYLESEEPDISESEKDKIKLHLIDYFKKHINKDFIAVIAYVDDKAVSTAFMVVFEKPANLSFLNGITANVLNVYTYPKYRKMGIATKVISAIITEAKKADVTCIDLNATALGKPLYEKLGFEKIKNTAMRFKL